MSGVPGYVRSNDYRDRWMTKVCLQSGSSLADSLHVGSTASGNLCIRLLYRNRPSPQNSTLNGRCTACKPIYKNNSEEPT